MKVKKAPKERKEPKVHLADLRQIKVGSSAVFFLDTYDETVSVRSMASQESARIRHLGIKLTCSVDSDTYRTEVFAVERKKR